MKNNILIYALLGVLILSGCMPQSNYKPPEFEISEDFRIANVSTEDDSIVFEGDSLVYAIDSTNIAWKHFFKDEKLIELIDEGIKNNFDVRMALKSVEKYNLQYKQSSMELLPSINATIANPNYQFRSEDFHSPPNEKWYGSEEPPETMYNYRAQNITGLNFNWEIDIWGKIRSQRADKFARYLATREVKNAVKTELISSIASGYYNLLLLYEQLRVAESNYKLSKSTLKIVKLQYEAGNTTALAKQQTKSQMLTTKALIPKLKQNISEEENKLQFLTGELPGELDINKNSFDTIFSTVKEKYEIPLSMVDYRSDVKEALFELQAANSRVGVAQSKQYPKLSIDLNFGVNSMLASNWFNIPGALFGSIIGNLTQPIFNKKRNKVAFEKAKLDREIKEIELQKTVYLAINEISNSLTKMNALDEQVDVAEEQVENSRLTIFQSDLLFKSGYATYLEVINAQRVALESELQLNNLKQDRLQMKIQLYKALGGGW